MGSNGINTILDQLNNENFFSSLGLHVVKRGAKRWTCSCPFCGDAKHLDVDIQKGLWICSKCNESGNALTFYAKLKGVSNGKALAAIKEFAGIKDDIEPAPSKKSSRPKKANEDNGVPLDNNAMHPGPNQEVYRRLVELSPLTETHYQELQKKRGFSPEIIEQFQFRSGGSHMAQVVEQLKQEFSEDVLQSSGVLVNVNGALLANSQLTDDRVLIPYLDENGHVYHLRPHKLGFKGVPSHVYCRYMLRRNPDHIVLTEGEFKAVALLQWGIPALAVPGVQSFGKDNFERLVQLLREFDVKRVTVIFDNETKDDPKLPNFKEKMEDRYDTFVWSYILGWKLNNNASISTNIGWLPDEWRERGKIDFDGALAQGKTKEEILRVIRAAVPPQEFLSGLEGDARRIVQRKISRHFAHRIPVKREFNKYVITRRQGKESWEETISNFVIDIKASYQTSEGVIRNVEFVNEFGERSDVFPLLASDMAGSHEFKKFCFSKGNYVYRGKGDDLINIWELELMRDSGEFIYKPDQIGRIKNNLWLFANLAIKDGQVYKPDNDGIIWIDGKGYKPEALTLGTKGEAMENSIPSLYEGEIDIQDLARKIKHSIGSYDAYAAIGWAVATIFAEDIFRQYKVFPILYAHGKKEGGKSTLMRWILRLLGSESDGYSIAETTQNFIARALAYHSSLPIWFDEYRNDTDIIKKNGFFRSAYNRQFSGKGTTSAFQARGFSVHGTLAMAGQETPKDAALFSRLVIVQVSEYKRNRKWYDWLNANAHKFSYLAYHLILNYEKYRDKILTDIAEWKESLINLGINDRTAENWAIVAGSFGVVVFEDEEFIKWVAKTCKELKYSGEREQELNQFWDSLNSMQSIGEIDAKHLKVEGETLYVWFAGVYDLWAIYYRRKTGREPFDKNSILTYLKDEPYYEGLKSTRLNNIMRKCHTIHIPVAPDSVKELAEAVRAIDPSRYEDGFLDEYCQVTKLR